MRIRTHLHIPGRPRPPQPTRPLSWRITAYLERHAPAPQHLNDIAKGIKASRLATENAVHRMARDGDVHAHRERISHAHPTLCPAARLPSPRP